MRVAITALAVIALVLAFDVVGLLGGSDGEDTTTEGTAPPKAALPPDAGGITLDPDTGLISPATPATPAEANVPPDTTRPGDELATAKKSCGQFGRYSVAVVEGDVSCRVAQRVLHEMAFTRPLPGSWLCDGQETTLVCSNVAERAFAAWCCAAHWQHPQLQALIEAKQE
jgi:hypothetical protein